MGPPPGRPGAPLMALNADMFLIRNVMPNEDGRENLCANDFRQCMAAVTRPIVQSFTTPQGQTQFQEEFKEVYLSMLRSAGQGLQQELELVCDVYDCASVDIPEIVAPEQPVEPQDPQIPGPPGPQIPGPPGPQIPGPQGPQIPGPQVPAGPVNPPRPPQGKGGGKGNGKGRMRRRRL